MNTGKMVGNYLVGNKKGEGSYACVYEAIDNSSGAPIALKFIKPTANSTEINRFNNENNILHKLSHVNIIKPESLVLEYELGKYCYAMELADANLIGELYSNQTLYFNDKFRMFK